MYKKLTCLLLTLILVLSTTVPSYADYTIPNGYNGSSATLDGKADGGLTTVYGKQAGLFLTTINMSQYGITDKDSKDGTLPNKLANGLSSTVFIENNSVPLFFTQFNSTRKIHNQYKVVGTEVNKIPIKYYTATGNVATTNGIVAKTFLNHYNSLKDKTNLYKSWKDYIIGTSYDSWGAIPDWAPTLQGLMSFSGNSFADNAASAINNTVLNIVASEFTKGNDIRKDKPLIALIGYAEYFGLVVEYIKSLNIPENVKREYFDTYKNAFADITAFNKNRVAFILEPSLSVGIKGSGDQHMVMAQDIAKTSGDNNYSPYNNQGIMPSGNGLRFNKNSKNPALKSIIGQYAYHESFKKATSPFGRLLRNTTIRRHTGGSMWTFSYFTYYNPNLVIPKEGEATHQLIAYSPDKKTKDKRYADGIVNKVPNDSETIGETIQLALPITDNNLSSELNNENVDTNNIYLKLNVSREATSDKDVSRAINSEMWYMHEQHTDAKTLSQVFTGATTGGVFQVSKGSGTSFSIKPSTADDAAGNVWLKITKEEAQKILESKKTDGWIYPSSILFVDKTKDTKIAKDETLTYTYKSEVKLAYFVKNSQAAENDLGKNIQGKVVTKDITTPQTRVVKFKRGKVPDTPDGDGGKPKPIQWASSGQVETYSEYKHNAPKQEEFEAMAGVPTSERMFYSIGGTPYLVELELERIEKQKAVRKYHSYFTSVKSKYFDSDKATSVTVPSYSTGKGSNSMNIPNAHVGGSITVTWTGTVKNNGHDDTNSSGGTTSAENNYDFTDRDNANTEAVSTADAIKTALESMKFKAVSDGKTRQINSGDYSVDISKDEFEDPGITQKTSQAITDKDGNITGYTTVTANKSPDHNFTVTVKVNLEPYRIDGPEARHMLPQINDTWSSEVEFDYMRINNVRAWRLDKGILTGGDLQQLTGKSTVETKVPKDLLVDYINIAAEDKALHSRLRYVPTGETSASVVSAVNGYKTASPWLDEVEWNEGKRSDIPNSADATKEGTTDQKIGFNTRSDYDDWIKVGPGSPGVYGDRGKGVYYNNTTYGAGNRADLTGRSAEFGANGSGDRHYQQFLKRRNTPITPVAISDFVVLHTDEGDVPIFYHEKKAPKAYKADDASYGYLSSTQEEMWNNNKFGSKANPDTDTTYRMDINGYNGDYSNPDSKYSSLSSNKKDFTIFDDSKKEYESKLKSKYTIRDYKRPTTFVHSEATGLINKLVPNGEYDTGRSVVTWKFLDIRDTKGSPKNTKINGFNHSIDRESKDFTEDSNYSDHHDKINNIVIHDPVSSQYAIVKSLPNNLDQRTDEYKGVSMKPKFDPSITITKNKEVHPKQNFIYNTKDPKGHGTFNFPVGWELVNGIAKVSGGRIIVNGEIKQRIKIIPNKDYTFTSTTNNAVAFLEFEGSSPIQLTSGMNVLTPAVSEAYLHIRATGQAVGEMRLELVNGTTEGFQPQEYITQYNITETNPDYVEAPDTTVSEHEVMRKEVHGTYKFIPEYSGEYEITIAGAQGGGSPANSGSTGTLGNQVVFKAILTKGTEYNVVIGGKGGDSPQTSIDQYDGVNTNGGYNGGAPGVGSAGPGGGGYTIITINGVEYIAGGGGGNFNGTDAKGFGGAYGHEGAIAKLKRVVSSYPNDTGGGGGGYRGGAAPAADDNKTAYSGTNRTNGGVENNTVRYGDGLFVAKVLGVKDTRTPEQKIKEISAEFSNTIVVDDSPEDWKETITKKHSNDATLITSDGSFTPGNFILVDRGFQIYFPNIGDYYDTNELGISQTTTEKGRGWRNRMDTSKWLRSKKVRFPFPVIYEGHMYLSGEWVMLKNPKTTSLYDFYAPLGAGEHKDATVVFFAEAENAPANYAQNMTDPEMRNFYRSELDKAAYHNAYKLFDIDVVGRIGNNEIVDSGDFRFANFFKNESVPKSWYIRNLMPNVDANSQKNIVGDRIDIRGIPFNGQPNSNKPYLDTYGYEGQKRRHTYPFPLTGDFSQVPGLKTQPPRIGYKTYLDVETIGDYGNGELLIEPKYYMYNLATNEIDEVDAYIKTKDGYTCINKHNGDTATSVKFPQFLNWNNEHVRRTYFSKVSEAPTNADGSFKYQTKEHPNTIKMRDAGSTTPVLDDVLLGDAEMLYLRGEHRTFIGSTNTYGYDKNPGNRLDESSYYSRGHRWHYTLELPSSARFIESGKNYTPANSAKYLDGKWVLLTGVKQIAKGSVFHLKGGTDNGTSVPIPVRMPNGDIKRIPIDLSRITTAKIILVSNPNKSSADDLDTHGNN